MLGVKQDSVPVFAVSRSFGEGRCSAIYAGLPINCQRWFMHLSKFMFQKMGMWPLLVMLHTQGFVLLDSRRLPQHFDCSMV